jgi:hypothetical protein
LRKASLVREGRSSQTRKRAESPSRISPDLLSFPFFFSVSVASFPFLPGKLLAPVSDVRVASGPSSRAEGSRALKMGKGTKGWEHQMSEWLHQVRFMPFDIHDGERRRAGDEAGRKKSWGWLGEIRSDGADKTTRRRHKRRSVLEKSVIDNNTCNFHSPACHLDRVDVYSFA